MYEPAALPYLQGFVSYFQLCEVTIENQQHHNYKPYRKPYLSASHYDFQKTF